MRLEGSPVVRVRRPRLWISETAIAVIDTAARDTHPHEAGGVLLGVLTERGRPWITEAVAVPSARLGRSSYELPVDARPKAADAARVRDNRLGYIGDWHSHPADVGPSDTDLETMKQIARDPDAACPHPVLLVARRTTDGYRLDGHQLARRKLRRLRVITAGGVTQSCRRRGRRR